MNQFNERNPGDPPFPTINRRFRGRIWLLTPKQWMTIGMCCLIVGQSLISINVFEDIPELHRSIACKVGICLMIFGAALLASVRRDVIVRSQDDSFPPDESGPPPVYLSHISTIHPDWVSALLLPRFDPSQVEGQRQPGYQGQIAQPRRLQAIMPNVHQPEHQYSQPSTSYKKDNLKSEDSFQTCSAVGGSTAVPPSEVQLGGPDDLSRTSRGKTKRKSRKEIYKGRWWLAKKDNKSESDEENAESDESPK